jgi:sarcosine oxidase subunit alpha
MEAGAAEGIRPFGVEAQRVLRLEKAHLIVGQDTDALSDPFAAGLAWAVKLQEKGDFLGRPSLERLSRTAPAQRLTGFKMDNTDDVPAEGVQIVATERGQLRIIGHVTSSRFSPTLDEAIGLCWLPASLAAEAGTPFTIRLEDGRLVRARVHHGAFYDPEGERLRR